MPNLIFAINAYNEVQLLPDCIKSIRSNTPEGTQIVVVDGAYRVFIEQAKLQAAEAIKARNGILADSFLRFSSPASNDGMLELLDQLKVDRVIHCQKDPVTGDSLPWENEFVKRSMYFIGTQGDIYIVIDADERIITTKPITIESIQEQIYPFDHGCIPLKRDDGIRPYPILRVHKHFDGMKYYGSHHALWVNGQLIRKDELEEKACISTFYLDHRWSERAASDRVRHMAKGAYYRKLMDSEGEFRTKHKI